MRRVILDLGRATTRLAYFLALIHQLADFLAVMKKMRLIGGVIFSACPEREAEKWIIPLPNVITLIEHITDRQVPILIDVIDKMIHVVWTRLIRMDLRDFHLAGEECRVAAHQFIPHLDREVHRAGVSDAFVFRNAVAAAALRLP